MGLAWPVCITSTTVLSGASVWPMVAGAARTSNCTPSTSTVHDW